MMPNGQVTMMPHMMPHAMQPRGPFPGMPMPMGQMGQMPMMVPPHMRPMGPMGPMIPMGMPPLQPMPMQQQAPRPQQPAAAVYSPFAAEPGAAAAGGDASKNQVLNAVPHALRMQMQQEMRGAK
jgi:hypothetical protein